MRYNTGNPLGSSAVKDIYDNAANFDEWSNSTSPSFPDRFNRQRETMHGAQERANVQISRAEAAAQDAIAAASASGDFIFAIDLADMASKLPLPDETIVEVAKDSDHDGARTRYVIKSGVPTFAINLDVVRNEISTPAGNVAVGGFDSYATLRAYSGPATKIPMTGPVGLSKPAPIWGDFLRDDFDTTSEDDGGTVIVDAIGRRWKRAGLTELEARFFGIKANGIDDDSAAMDLWAAAFEKARGTGPCKAVVRGRVLLGRPLVIRRSASGSFRSELDISAAEFICNFNRSQYPYFMFFGDPLSLTTYQGAIDVIGRFIIRKGPLCTNAPIGIKLYGAAQSSYNRVDSAGWDNTVTSWHGPQNVAIKDFTLYFGGKTWGYRDFNTSRYTWSGDRVARLSGGDIFHTDIVGKTVSVSTTVTAFNLVVLERISETEIRVDRSNSSSPTASRILRAGSCAPKVSNGSPIVYIDGDMPIDGSLVGLPIAIPRAGISGKIHFATVIATDSATRSITIDKPCGATLDPTLNPSSDTTDIATPAHQFLSDRDAGYTNGISQLRFFNGQIESFAGVAMAFDDAELVEFFGVKTHGVQSSYSWLNNSVGAIWANTISGRFIGQFDARYYGQYRIHICDNTMPFTFMDLQLRVATYEKVARIGLMRSGSSGAIVNFGTLGLVGASTTADIADLVTDENTTFRGYFPPMTFIKAESSLSTRYLSSGSYFRLNGDFSLGNGTVSYNATTGLFTIGSGTAKWGVTSRGARYQSAPGPFASSGEAISAGLVSGDVYRDASGFLKIVL